MRLTRSFLVMAGVAALGLSACDNGASAVETRDRATVAEDAKPTDGGSDGEAAKSADTSAGAKPVLTANRRETVDAKVQRLFERNGADFGTPTAEAYLAAITAFTTAPPADAETVRRAKGDRLHHPAARRRRDGETAERRHPDLSGLDQHLCRGRFRRGAAHHVQA